MSAGQDVEQPPYRMILDGIRRGEVIPFLGSGASLPSALGEQTWRKDTAWRFPRADELAESLAGQANYPSGVPGELSLVAQYFDRVSGRVPLTRYLHDIFVCDHLSTKLHAFLAERMTHGIVITTNYDNLLERAFGDKPFDLVVHAIDVKPDDRVLLLRHGDEHPEPVSPAKLPVDGSERPLIYKMHGTVDARDPHLDQFLITEDDYVDFLTRMTRKKVLPAPVTQALMHSNVLFLGYGLRDWNVRVVLNGITSQYHSDTRTKHGFVSWAVQYQVNVVERANWDQRGVRVFEMSIADFVDQLEREEERMAGEGRDGEE